MGLFEFLKQPDINMGVQEYRNTADSILLDVRTPVEFREGHIPGSINLPLQSLDNADEIIENIDTPIFVYCHSGARSRQAMRILQTMGYSNVMNIGGIAAYHGKVER